MNLADVWARAMTAYQPAATQPATIRYRCPHCPDVYWRDTDPTTCCFVCDRPGQPAVTFPVVGGSPHTSTAASHPNHPPLDGPLVDIAR